MKKFQFKSLPTPNRKTGYIIESLPDKFHSLMDLYVNTKHTDELTSQLAGHLNSSYTIDHTNKINHEFNNYIIDLSLKLDMFLDSKYETLKIKKFWINYQKKYEFNPIHFHDGDFSFVIWYKIPYIMEDEKTFFKLDSETINGCFTFYYELEDTVAGLSLMVDKTWEKTICVFPSKLQHSVMPFYTSDEYRITFSGNLESV
jgi:hypothetical protein